MSAKMLNYNSELYERIRVLGKGSYGTAIVHRRRTDCALVVLKEIDLTRFADEHRRAAALQEARIMSELAHANIINYFNAYATDKRLIIEMEYARNGTLQSYLANQSELLAEEEALNIFRQIVAGLEYLHAKRIVHLDLKMGNIFISAEGTIKLGDFGIAQFMAPADSKTPGQLAGQPPLADPSPRFVGSTSRQLGTLAYSSPERCLGLPTDYQSDIWSLGCILYELITLRLLFGSESLAELVASITQVKYQPIELVSEHISPLTLQMFEQLISKDPGERPSASELMQLVDQSLGRLERTRAGQSSPSGKRERRAPRQQTRPDLSTEAANFALDRRNILNQIKYPHSLVYQVRLDKQNVRLERVNLPQSKRIKQIVKGGSHYLALTYDNIVYGWGSRSCGQLGSSKLTLSCARTGADKEESRKSRSARNSFTTRDSLKAAQWRPPINQMVSLTQPPSLASSTQNLDVPGAAQVALDYESILCQSSPTSKPFIISELNKRKIELVAAGNNFSVFLSKTGIVMTCGDGSAGCLGRGDLARSLSPRMVDSLLSMDVVSIASGPEHVVAVSGNGQAFVWGNIGSGRLGLGDERALSERLMYSKVNVLKKGKYVTSPQQVKFAANRALKGTNKLPGEISIVGAYCGDKSTVFIDSNRNCWACGENRHNKLGLDIQRKFKRTIVVNNSWTPARIVALSKYKILACCIGPNHSTFLTSEGKIIVLGQDIDHSYRLKRDIMEKHDSQRFILAQLQEPGHRTDANCFTRRKRRVSRPPVQTDREHLAQSLLANNQLVQFKSEQLSWKLAGEDPWQKKYPKMKASRLQRRQIETYLKRSRALKRLPFDGALAVSCTSKFTLALTSDNRVYFWGTRSYKRDDCCTHTSVLESTALNGREDEASLQLVPPEKDECFIKISGTNSTLMDNIQLLGSDQPILHARDPLLVANSLADLWILDYRPSDSSSTSKSDLSKHSSDSAHSSSDSSSSSFSSSFAQRAPRRRRRHDCLKHDAILEPQPIVSLYVPSMFNYNGCALRLVNLFCHDEERFFLVLDTTITVQQQQQQPPHSPHRSAAPSPSLAAQRAPNSRRGSHQSSKLHIERSQMSFQSSKRAPNQWPNEAQQVETRLNLVEESRSQSKCGSESGSWKDARRASCNPSLINSAGVTKCAHEWVTSQSSEEDAHASKHVQMAPECCRQTDGERQCSGHNSSPPDGHSTATNGNSLISPALQISPVSQNGFSLEEPRSMSTFLPNLDPQHNNTMVGPSMGSFGCPLRRLNFDRYKQRTRDNSSEALGVRVPQQRRHRSMVNLSESNGLTCDDFDETTSMPTWVKDEFLQQQAPSVGLQGGPQSGQMSRETQSCSESDLTSDTENFESALSASSRERPTKLSSSSLLSCTEASAYQSTLVGSRGRLEELDQREAEPIRGATFEQRRLSAPTGTSLDYLAGSVGGSLAHVLSASQPALGVHQRTRRLRRETLEMEEEVICDNIINCSVYKDANRLRVGESKSNLDRESVSDFDQQKVSNVETLLRERSLSQSCQIGVAQMSLASSNPHATTCKEHPLSNLLVPTLHNDANRGTKLGERYSSSCVEMRDTSAEVTMIEMLERGAGAQGVSPGAKDDQVGWVFEEKRKRGSKWRRAINGLSGSQSFSCAKSKRTPSLSSLRKSLTGIFC